MRMSLTWDAEDASGIQSVWRIETDSSEDIIIASFY